MHDGVVGDAQPVERLQQHSDVHVVFDHGVGVLVLTGNAANLILDVGAEVHSRAVPPDIEGLVLLNGALDEVDGCGQRFLIDRLHPIPGQGTGILDLAVGCRADHAARSEAFAELRIGGIVRILGLLLGVQVVEIAEELVEPMVCRQMFVLVAQMVLAELSGHVTLRLQQTGDCRILLLHAQIGTGKADFREAGPENALPCDVGGAAGRAGLFSIVVGEHHAFLGDAVDVRRAITHQSEGIGRDVRLTDIVAPDHQNVRPLRLCECGRRDHCRQKAEDGGKTPHRTPLLLLTNLRRRRYHEGIAGLVALATESEASTGGRPVAAGRLLRTDCCGPTAGRDRSPGSVCPARLQALVA